MDVNQLIRALGDAAGSAKSPQEYCFLWIDWWATCMTKAEWSGWMQAIFSVIAILMSAFLLRHQLRHNELAIKRSAVSRIRTFVAFLASYVDRFTDTADFNSLEMKRQGALLQSQIDLSINIQADVLNIEWIAALESARAVAIQLKVLADSTSVDPKIGLQNRNAAKELALKIASIEATVVQDHPGVRVWR